jgi:serine/threonine protein kinase
MEPSRTSIPEKIGKYDVQKVLGRGSMGVVYLARDPLIDREVAIKTIVLPPGLDEDRVKEFRARFLREARAAGRMSHPAIVTIYEADEGKLDGYPFIVMEFVEGLPWNLKIRQHTFPDPEQVMHLAREIASGLDYAHRNGVVHRDIKPANIVQTPDGRVKLMDFGIAKVPTSELTREGQFLGTPAYMSPEQVMGKVVDGRSDLFSLGTVLYELLTCQKPFPGEDITTVTYGILKEDPRPARSFNPGIPEEVDRILFHLMAKEVDQRYASAKQVIEDIDAYMAEASLPHAGNAPMPWVENAPQAAAPPSPAAPPPPPAPVAEAARPPAPPAVKPPQPSKGVPAPVPSMQATVVAPPPPAPAPAPATEATRPSKGRSLGLVVGGLGLLAVVALGILVAAFFWYRSTRSAPEPDVSSIASREIPAGEGGAAEPDQQAAQPEPTPIAPTEAPKPKPKPKPVVPPPVVKPPEPPPQPPPKPVDKPPEVAPVSFAFTSGTKRGELWIRIDGKEVAHQVINRKGSIFSQETHSGSFGAPAGTHQVEFQIKTELQNLNETHTESATFVTGQARTLTITMTKFNKEIRFAWSP